MRPFKKLAGQTAIYGLPSILGRTIGYLLVPIYTRVFNKSDYGTIILLYSYVSFLIVILSYGMETAFFRFSQTKKNKNIAFSTGDIMWLEMVASHNLRILKKLSPAGYKRAVK